MANFDGIMVLIEKNKKENFKDFCIKNNLDMSKLLRPRVEKRIDEILDDPEAFLERIN